MLKLKIGVDVGGTFTDVVGISDEGEVYFAKTPSTPQDQSIGVLNGIRMLPQFFWLKGSYITEKLSNIPYL